MNIFCNGLKLILSLKLRLDDSSFDNMYLLQVLVRALGGLLSFLQSTVFQLEDGQLVTINSLRQAKADRYMIIDHVTLNNLHIFATEHHPLLAKGPGNSKEGFSLFALLDRCKSKIGRQCLREWMMKPLLDVEMISSRQDGIELFLSPDCDAAVQNISWYLQKVGAVDKVLLRMQKCITAPSDFLVLMKTLEASLNVCSILLTDLTNLVNKMREEDEGCNDTFALRAKAFLDGILKKCHLPILSELHQRMISIIDQEMTAEAKTNIVLHFGFDEELDSAKEALERLDGKFATAT